MSARYSQFHSEASELGKKGRYHDAAVVEEQALRIAQEYQMENELYQSRVWAAYCWEMAGYPTRAMALLLDARRNEPLGAETYYKWVARKHILTIGFYQIQPDIDLARKRLDDLNEFYKSHFQLPIDDLSDLEADLLRAQGDWEQSLQLWELSWTQFSSKGYVKHSKAFNAIACCFNLGLVQEAEEWCKLLEQTERDRIESRLAWKTASATIALYRGEYAQAMQFAEAAEQFSDTIQTTDAEATLLHARAFLLDSSYGDPVLSNHPARFRLVKQLRRKHFWEMKYSRFLLLVDYRLATVRYIVGIGPIDDLWYQQTQHTLTQLPSHFEMDEYDDRVFRTKLVIRRATKFAKWLDENLQCNLRQAELQERSRRLQEIEIAVERLRRQQWEK